MKKVFSLIVSLVLCILCYPAMIVESAVIEPKLVHTERWTTSYYLDDDKDTLYPYIQCVADIYSNGSVYLYLYNTQEWNSYASVKNDVTIRQSYPYRVDEGDYILATKGKYTNEEGYTYTLKNKPDIDVSYYPVGYSYQEEQYGDVWCDGNVGQNEFDSYIISLDDITLQGRYGRYSAGINIPRWHGALCNLSFFANEPDYIERNLRYIDSVTDTRPSYKYKCFCAFFTNDATVLQTKNKFRLFGHEFTVTPEMLSSETPTEPTIENSIGQELEKYKALYEEAESKLKELEADNEYKDKIINTLCETITALESQVEHWKKNCGDCDDDGRISISDSIILNRYLAGTVDSLPCSDPPPLAPEDGGSD